MSHSSVCSRGCWLGLFGVAKSFHCVKEAFVYSLGVVKWHADELLVLPLVEFEIDIVDAGVWVLLPANLFLQLDFLDASLGSVFPIANDQLLALSPVFSEVFRCELP